MANPKPPTRAQLARFLQDAESIKAFEKLFEMAGDTTPTDVLELSYLANTLKSRIQDAARKLSEMEGMQVRVTSINNIESRLHELEIQVAKRSSDDAILRRIEDLEKLTGV